MLATDGDVVARLDRIHNYYIYLCDENDNAPIFGQTLYFAHFFEDLPAGGVVHPIGKIDADVGSYCRDIDSAVTNDNYLLNITIVSGDTSIFTVDNSLQAIVLIAQFDFDTAPATVFDLTIEVDDFAPPVQTAQTIVRITVVDTNDNAPIFQQVPYNVEVEESVYSASDVIINITAVDADSGLNGDVKFRIVGGNELGLFAIHIDLGVITTNGTKELDADPKDVIHILVVEAYDLGIPAQRTSIPVTITVINTNDNTPRFYDVNGAVVTMDTVSINEDIPKNFLLYRTIANDSDGDLLFFTITSDPSNAFTIGSISGLVYSTMDTYCMDSSYSVTIVIQARDREFTNAKNSSLTLTINFEDVNDFAPEFCPSSFAITAPSPLAANTDIGVLSPFDKDKCNTGFIFTITGGADQSLFTFNGNVLQTTTPISFTENAEFEIIVQVADTGSSSVLQTTATINVVLTQFVPISIDIENGYFTSLPAYSHNTVSQESNLFSQLTPDQDGFIHATLGTLSGSYRFQHAPLPATNYKLDQINTVVYADSKYLYLSMQRRTELKSTHISGETNVVLTASDGSQTESDTFTISSSHGITIMSLVLADPWFNVTAISTANLEVEFQGETTTTETLTFSINPYFNLPIISPLLGNLILRVPQRTLYIGESFDIFVYAEAIGRELVSLEFSITVSSSEVTLVGVESVPGWSAGFAATANTAEIATFKADQNAPAVTGKRYLTVKARVANSISADSANIVVDYTIVQLSNAIESSVPLETSRVVISRFGYGQTGSLYVSRKQLSAVYASTATPHILNTAVLTGSDVSLFYSAYAVIANTIPYLDVNINVGACTGSASVFTTSNPGCNAVLTSASVSTVSLEELTLTIGVDDSEITGTLEDIASYRIWTPSLADLTLGVTDSKLSVIANFEHFISGTCLGVYQDAEIYATTDFQFPTGSAVSIRVEKLIAEQITLSPTGRISRDGTKITGLSSGVTTLTYKSKSVLVTTDTTPLTVDRLSIIVATGLTFNNPLEPMYPVVGPQTVQVGYVQDLNRPARDAQLIAYAKFSDGSHRIVDAAGGITFASTDNGVATVSGSTLSIVGEGVGCYVTASWSSLDSCTTPTVSNGEGFIDIVFDEPDDLTVTLTETDIVHVSDEANTLIATQTQIIVRLVYGDDTIDMTSDPRTEYSFENSRITLARSDCSVSCVFSVQGATDSGLANIRVKFSHITIFKEISVNVYKSDGIEFIFAHEPSFPGSASVPVFPLSPIESTGLFQRAFVSVQLNLISGLNDLATDVSTLSGLQIQSNVTSVLIISSRILEPQAPGASYLIGTLGPFSAVREIIISSTAVGVDTFSLRFVNSINTLSGQQGESADRFIVNIEFSDGTFINDIFSSGSNYLPGLILFDSTDFFDLDQTTGYLTILANSPRAISYTLMSTVASNTFQLYSNLEASDGDLDLGKESGLPIDLPDGTTTSFQVPLRINSGRVSGNIKRSLGGINGYITFDPSVFVVTAFTKHPLWPGDVLDVNIDSIPGRVSFSAPLQVSESDAYVSLSSDAVDIFSLTVNYKSGITDDANFSTEVVTFIESMIDSSTPPQSITTNSESIAGTFWIGQIQNSRRRRSLGNSFIRDKRQTADCGGETPPGDTDGDCVFTVADVTYALNYIVEAAANFPTPAGGYYSDATERQLRELDPNLDTLINSNDPSYLNRILVGFLPFVRDVVILSTHEYNISQCRIIVEATIVDKDNSPVADTNEVAFYAGLFTTDPGFQAEISALNPEPGFGSQVASTEQETNFNGQFYRTEISNNTYNLRLLPEFTNDYNKTAVILAVTTINILGTTTPERISTFFSSNVNPVFMETFDKTITDGSLSIHIRKTNRFNPLRTIPIYLTYSECNNIGSPEFDRSNYTGSVFENATNGFVVLTVQATDPDNFTNAEIVYSLSSQSVDNQFVIDPVSGGISVNGELDRETVPSYTFKVTARDKGILQVLSGEVSVVITVLDVNDNAPIFNLSSYGEFVLAEDIPLNTVIVQVAATDRDIGNNGEIVYSLDSDCLGYFAVSLDGTVRTAKELDYEDVQTFQCTIIATDQGEIPNFDTTFIDIVFTPLNDLSPQCPAILELSLAGNAPLGHVVDTITAQDDDLGEDHNILSYELVDSSNYNFYILQISNNQVELRTNRSSYTTGEIFDVTLNTTDRVWHYCVTQIRIFVEESSYFDFSFSIPKIAHFLTIPQYNFALEAYEQDIGFFVDNKDTASFQATAERAGQTQSTAITKAPQAAVSAVGVIRGSVFIYFDQPWLRVTAQFSSSSGSTYINSPTSARIEVTSQTESLTATASICTPNVLTDGICEGTVNFSPDWFNSGHSANVTITLDGNEFAIQEINFRLKPSIPSVVSENLMLSVPHFDIYPSDVFDIQLSAYTRYEPIGYQVEISYPVSRLSPVGSPHYTTVTGWLCSSSSTSDGTDITENYVCNYANTDALTPGRVDRFTDLLTLRFQRIGTISGDFTIRPRGISLTANNAVIYSVGSSTVAIHTYDYNNGFEEGHPNPPSDPTIYFLDDSQIRVFGFVEDSEIINDIQILDLSSKTIDAGIGLRGVMQNPIQAITTLGFTGFTCTSQFPSILEITGDCLLQLTRGVTTNGSDLVSVTIRQGADVISTVSFRVWVPVLVAGRYVSVSFSDNLLQPITNCPGLYQETRVRLRAVFKTPSSSAVHFYFSDFSNITTSLSRTDLATYANGIISVNLSFSESSSVDVKLSVLNNANVIGEGMVTVDPNDPVTLEVIKPEIFTELSLESVPDTISDLSGDRLYLRARLTENCDADLKENYVSTKAIFSDGHTQVLDNLVSDLELKPYSLILRHKSGLTLEAYGSGSGPVEVCWKCSATTERCGTTSVTCSIPPPDSQSLGIDANEIAFDGSIANLAGYPNVATITEISLTYGGAAKDVRFDERTTIAINDPDNLFNFNNLTLQFTPRTETGSGFASITVTFFQAPSVVLTEQIQLVRHKEIQLTLSPYPLYPGSSFNVVSNLRRVSGTNVFQQGMLSAVLETTTSEIIDVTSLANYLTNTVILNIDSSQIVTPLMLGSANISADFNGLTASVSINVLNDTVDLASIASFQLPQGSLNKRVNESEILDLDINLTDGTVIIDFFSYSYYGANQRLVILSATDTRGAIRVQQNGQVFILDNHYGNVVVRASGGNNIEATTAFAVNLIPEIGDFDLGRTSGIPFGPLTKGVTYTIPIRVNAGSLNLSSFDLEIEFEGDVFQPTGVASVFHSGNIAIESSIPSRKNIYKFVGVLATPLKGIVDFGDFELQVKSDAPSGITRINVLIVELVDVNENMITPSDTLSMASDIEIEILGNRRRSVPMFHSRAKRGNYRFRRAPGQLPCGKFGDASGDGAFTVLDAQVVRDSIASGTTPAGNFDVNQNGAVDINDVIYLIRGLAFSLPFLCNITIYPVLEDVVCNLRIEISLENSDGNTPPSEFTFPHVMVQHTYITPAVNDWDVSVVTFGAKSNPTPAGVSPLGGLWEAYPSLTNDGSYLVDIETALSANDIGVTVVIMTANTQFSSPRSRFVSLYKPSDTFNFDQIPNYAITSNREPRVSQPDSFIGASGGYDPFVTFDNVLRSDLCLYSDNSYFVEEGLNSPLVVGLVGALTLGGTQGNYVVTNGDPGNSDSFFITALINGSQFIITDLLIDAEFTDLFMFDIDVSVPVAGAPVASYSQRTARFNISVIDSNDNPPIFTETKQAFVILENTPVGTTLFRFQAIDADSGTNGEITYSISRGFGKDDFYMNATTGELIVAGFLDRENMFAYQIEILATDNGLLEQLSAEFNSTITLNDRNDNPPSINSPSIDFYISENSNPGELLSHDSFRIKDPDNGDNGTISSYLISDIRDDLGSSRSLFLFEFVSQSQVS